MDLEELILRYYLSLFSIILILVYIFVITNIISIYDKNTIIKISKGQPVSSITSNALSGRYLSLINLSESLTAAIIASLENFTL